MFALGLTVLCFNVIPSDTIGWSIAQTAAAAACVIMVMAVYKGSALRFRQPINGKEKQRHGIKVILLVILVGAFVCGLATLWFGWPTVLALQMTESLLAGTKVSTTVGLSPGNTAFMLAFLVLCALTGLFEEVLFRGIVFDGFAKAFQSSQAKQPALRAAVLSAVIFGALHMGGVDPSGAVPLDGVAAVQLVFKPLQAAFFGFIMAALYYKTQNLWLIVGTHALYNVFSEGPLVLFAGYLPTSYITGNPYDLLILVVSMIFLVPLLPKSTRILVQTN